MGLVSLGMGLGTSVPVNQSVIPSGFAVVLTGLTGGTAQPGDQASISYTMVPNTGTQSVQWGIMPDDASFGTAPNPTDFTSADGGQLWLTVTDGADSVSRSAPIRHTAPASLGALPDVTIAVGDLTPLSVAGDFQFDGTSLYTLETAPTGLTIDSVTGDIDLRNTDVMTQAAVIVRLSDANDPTRFAESGFNLSVEDFALIGTTSGEIEIDNAAGEVTVTVTAPLPYSSYDAGNGPGVFIFDVDALTAGPLNLVPPIIADDGTPDVTDTLTVIPGLWIHDAENGALSEKNYQWQRDGSDIPGAANESYTLASGDEGSTIQVTETLSDNGGIRSASSPLITVAGATTWSAPAPVADAGSVSLTAGSNQPSAPSAPIIDTVGDRTVTLNAA